MGKKTFVDYINAPSFLITGFPIAMFLARGYVFCLVLRWISPTHLVCGPSHHWKRRPAVHLVRGAIGENPSEDTKTRSQKKLLI